MPAEGPERAAATRHAWVMVFATLVEDEDEDEGAAGLCMDGDVSQARLRCASCGPAS